MLQWKPCLSIVNLQQWPVLTLYSSKPNAQHESSSTGLNTAFPVQTGSDWKESNLLNRTQFCIFFHCFTTISIYIPVHSSYDTLIYSLFIQLAAAFFNLLPPSTPSTHWSVLLRAACESRAGRERSALGWGCWWCVLRPRCPACSGLG